MKKETIMGLFIAFIMISSMFAVVISQMSDSSKTKYNGKVFEYVDGRLYTEVNDQEIYFFNSPDTFNTSYIPDEFISTAQNTGMLYFTLDEDDTLINEIMALGYDLSTNVFATNNLYIQGGTTLNGTKDTITCANATKNIPVIYVRENNNTQVTFENNCLIANVQSNNDIIKLRDGILYKYYNIK